MARRTRLQVSHETICNAIYAHPKGELRKSLIACLRQGRSSRKYRAAGTDRRSQIPEVVSIHVRPPEVNVRVMPGHWVGDLIKGADNRSAVAVLVERSTRMALLAKMSDATAESALVAFTGTLNQIAQSLPASMLIRTLGRLVDWYGAPLSIRMDNRVDKTSHNVSNAHSARALP